MAISYGFYSPDFYKNASIEIFRFGFFDFRDEREKNKV